MELLDIVDEKGNPTGQTVDREKAHREGIRHRSSHVWLFRRRAGRVEFTPQAVACGAAMICKYLNFIKSVRILFLFGKNPMAKQDKKRV